MAHITMDDKYVSDDPNFQYNPKYLAYLSSDKSKMSSPMAAGWVGEIGSSGGNSVSEISKDSSGRPVYAYRYSGTSSAMPPVPKYGVPDIAPAPTYKYDFKEMPTYTPPAWSDAEIESLTQKRAAPGIRELRQQVQRVTGRRFDNPQVGRMTLREALQGYGSGLGSVLGSASSAASGEYANKYSRQLEASKAAYQSEAAKVGAYNENMRDMAKTQYGGAMDEWRTRAEAARAEAKMNYLTNSEIAKEGRSYMWKQRELDDAWDRWKQQQSEKYKNPVYGG